jgi:hypothetical protein
VTAAPTEYASHEVFSVSQPAISRSAGGSRGVFRGWKFEEVLVDATVHLGHTNRHNVFEKFEGGVDIQIDCSKEIDGHLRDEGGKFGYRTERSD